MGELCWKFPSVPAQGGVDGTRMQIRVRRCGPGGGMMLTARCRKGQPGAAGVPAWPNVVAVGMGHR